MKIFYAGCNIFGQIMDCDNITIDCFTEFNLKTEEYSSNFLLSHTFNIIQTSENKIKLHGHGFKPKTTHVSTELSLPSGNKIVDISCSDTRILVLNDVGEFFVLDLLERPIELRQRQGLFLNDLHEDDKIIRIANGMTINVAVSEMGRIFAIPNLLNYNGAEIVHVCCGYEHCLILDKIGNVYSFGNNSRGQLGIGNLNSETDPVLIETLAGLRISQIASGGWHSVALSTSGDAYVWGWNNEGQLADIDCNEEQADSNGASVWATPTLLKLPDSDASSGLDERILGIACGSRHTVVVNDQGVIYGMGCNKFNQLGLKNMDNLKKITSLHTIKNYQSDTVKIKCGPAATAIIMKS